MQVWFEADIEVTQKDLDDAEGSIIQAVQNLVGSTGAKVLTTDPEDGEE